MGEKEAKEGVEIKTINVPGGVYVGGGPTFASSSYIRHTKEGEQFPWVRTRMNEGKLWFGGGGDGWVPTRPGKKEGEPRVFYKDPDTPVLLDRDEELKWQEARIREAKKGGPAGEAAERLLDFHKRAKRGE